MTDAKYITPLSDLVTSSEQLWLVKLVEECAEVQQAASKVLRHGWKSYNPDNLSVGTNEQQLDRELSDVDHAVTKLYALRRDRRAD